MMSSLQPTIKVYSHARVEANKDALRVECSIETLIEE